MACPFQALQQALDASRGPRSDNIQKNHNIKCPGRFHLEGDESHSLDEGNASPESAGRQRMERRVYLGAIDEDGGTETDSMQIIKEITPDNVLHRSNSAASARAKIFVPDFDSLVTASVFTHESKKRRGSMGSQSSFMAESERDENGSNMNDSSRSWHRIWI
jgi:hypothetical protein